MTQIPDIFHCDADNVIRFKGHRIRLIDVAARFEEGHSPEAIVTDYYPTLTLAQVYRAVAFHLENEDEVRGMIAANQSSMQGAMAGAKTAPSLEELRGRLTKFQRPEAS